MARVYLCHVTGSDSAEDASADKAFEAALQRLIPNSSYDWCSPGCVVGHGDAAEAILGLAERVEADLIVLGARKASLWLTHVELGLSAKLLTHAGCPVMTVC